MKKVWWVVRIAVIVIASYCIFAPSGALTFRAVQAQEDAVKCETTASARTLSSAGRAAMAVTHRMGAPPAEVVAVAQTEITN
jgi:hypothetical protein